jgi:holo-[acyl-carrier protein] synthase
MEWPGRLTELADASPRCVPARIHYRICLDAQRKIAAGRASCAARAMRRRQIEMIVGTGIDIAEIDRIEAAITRHGVPFLERLFTPAEITYCERHKHKYERYAARFAVKEAVMKALGTGWSRGVRWRDIEVVNQPSGKPTLRLAGVAGELAERLGVKHISISITHSGNLAFSQVIFES